MDSVAEQWTRPLFADYAWCVETIAAAPGPGRGTVVDRQFVESFATAMARVKASPALPGRRYDVVLVCEDYVLDGRSWARVGPDGLPRSFTDATGTETRRVPTRFRSEVRRWRRSSMEQ